MIETNSFPFKLGDIVLFVMPMAHPDQEFCFSDKLEDIGINQNMVLKNMTEVTILSNPTKVISPKHGTINVIRVIDEIGGRAMWVLTQCLVPPAAIEWRGKNERFEG